MKTASAFALVCVPLALALCNCSSPTGDGKGANPSAKQASSPATTNPDVLEMTIGELLDHKEDYLGRKVEVTGHYISWFEGSILRETNDPAGSLRLWIDRFHLKQAHPGAITWVETGLVRVIGTFTYREGYGSGHLGMCPAEITEVELFQAIR